MGIVFDARKYNSGESYDGELGNGDEVVHIRKIVVDALNENIPGYSYKVKKKSILIKGMQDPGSYPQADRRVKSIKIKGAFQGLDISNKKTWSQAKIDSIVYGGVDGKIQIKGVKKADSLGSLGMWDRLSDKKFVSNLFDGDDIIYSTQKHRTTHKLKGYGGDDTFYLYGAEEVNCDNGAERVVVTKKALKYLGGGRNCMGIWIRKANLLEGDAVQIEGRESAMTLDEGRSSVAYSLGRTNCGDSVDIDAVNGQPVYADFI